MKIQLKHLIVRARNSTEHIDFSEVVTFIYGPIGKGKSTIARLIDYCLGGDLERTPAIQKEFLATELKLILGNYECTIERAAEDTRSVRVTWVGPDSVSGSVNAPLVSQEQSLLIDAEVYNLSDLIFHFCGVAPIKVRKRSRDPDSPLVRLSIRDIWWYCYLNQTHLDSSFYRLEDPFKGRKSQDAMRFFTGLHSERLSQLENDLFRLIDEQRAKREAVVQIRAFMNKFELGSELDIVGQLQETEKALARAEKERHELELARSAQIHPSDSLRDELRHMSVEVETLHQAINDSIEAISEQDSLRAELIAAKTKSERVGQSWRILEGVSYQRCPECGTDMSSRPQRQDGCRLCGSVQVEDANATSQEQEALRRDLNERIDQIDDSINRRQRELKRMERNMAKALENKVSLDKQLQDELARYDSAFIESIRKAERDIATLTERISSLKRLQLMPQAIDNLEEQSGAISGKIDRLKSSVSEEKKRLRAADDNISALSEEFKRVMLAVSFPGVSEEDEVIIDPRNWKPTVLHDAQEWTFWDTGSGGKKTLFNVCYALALHNVAIERRMPVPDILIIDSPTKNISEDEDPELVKSLYAEIYRIASTKKDRPLQLLLIDSECVMPTVELSDFLERRMAGEEDAPSLISYYEGP